MENQIEIQVGFHLHLSMPLIGQWKDCFWLEDFKTMKKSCWKPLKYRHKNILCLEKLVLTDETHNYRNISKIKLRKSPEMVKNDQILLSEKWRLRVGIHGPHYFWSLSGFSRTLKKVPWCVTKNGTVLVQNETFSVRDLKYLEKIFQIFKRL